MLIVRAASHGSELFHRIALSALARSFLVFASAFALAAATHNKIYGLLPAVVISFLFLAGVWLVRGVTAELRRLSAEAATFYCKALTNDLVAGAALMVHFVWRAVDGAVT